MESVRRLLGEEAAVEVLANIVTLTRLHPVSWLQVINNNSFTFNRFAFVGNMLKVKGQSRARRRPPPARQARIIIIIDSIGIHLQELK